MILGCFFIARKGVNMYEHLDEINLDVRGTILEEYFESIPTRYLEVDFEVNLLRIQIAFNNQQIEFEEMLELTDVNLENLMLWKKLNDK